MLLTTALAASEALVGPELGELVDPVPHADLDRAMLDGIPGLLADLDGDEANVLLTLVRIWNTLATGAINPKDVAADWALARLPAADREPIARSRAVYLGETPDQLGRPPARVDANRRGGHRGDPAPQRVTATVRRHRRGRCRIITP